MSQVNGRFIQDNAVTSPKLRLDNNTSLRARNAANSADVNLLKLDGSNITQLTNQTQISITPSVNNDVANKAYVDSVAGAGSVTASSGLIKVGSDIQPNYEPTNPTLQNSSGYIAVKLDSAGAIVSGSSGVGVQLEASNQSLAISSNRLGVKLNAAGAITSGASGVGVNLESSTPTLQIATNQLGVKLNASGAITTGALGVGVNLEASNPSLQIATNQLGVKFDPAGAVASGASGVAVQLESTNPTLQIATNQLGVKLNASGAIITGASGVAVQVDGVTVKINASNKLEGLKQIREIFALLPTDITNGYVDLQNTITSGTELVFAQGLLQVPVADYTLSTVAGKTRVTFAGDLLALQTGDRLTVSYSYL